MRKAEARPKGHGGGSGSSLGKIFVAGLPRDTTDATFVRHFGQYGEIVDSVIMKDKHTSQPRGFGFITYSDPAVVEIKRTIPKGSMQSNSKEFKTKKIFVGGLPSTLTEDDFKNFFTRYGTVADHQIMRDHDTKRSRGFGFIVFSSDQVVDDLLANGNMIDLAGSKMEIKKAEPKKSSNPPPSAYDRNSRSAYDSDPRDHPSADNYGGLASVYGNYSSGGFGPYRSDGGFGPFGGRFGSHAGMGEFGGGYGRYYAGFGGYGSASSFCYPSRFGSYGGFDGPYAGGDLNGYSRGGADESFGGIAPGSSGFGGAIYGGAYDLILL